MTRIMATPPALRCHGRAAHCQWHSGWHRTASVGPMTPADSVAAVIPMLRRSARRDRHGHGAAATESDTPAAAARTRDTVSEAVAWPA